MEYLKQLDISWSPVKKQVTFVTGTDAAGNYMFKVNNRNTRKRCGKCSKLTIKTPEQANDANDAWCLYY